MTDEQKQAFRELREWCCKHKAWVGSEGKVIFNDEQPLLELFSLHYFTSDSHEVAVERVDDSLNSSEVIKESFL